MCLFALFTSMGSAGASESWQSYKKSALNVFEKFERVSALVHACEERKLI